MPNHALRQLKTETVDFLHLVAVWLFVGIAAGDSLLGVVALVVPLPEWLSLPLLAGAVVVAVAELLDRRPTLGESLAFFVVTGTLTLAVVFPWLAILAPGPAVTAALDVGVVLAAGWVIFAGGYRRLWNGFRRALHWPPTEPAE